MRTVLTNRCLMCDVDGQWVRFDHGAVVELRPDPGRYQVTEFFAASPPLRLRGLWAPWVALAATWLVYGPQALRGRSA